MGNFFTDLFSDQPAKDAADAIKAGYATGVTNAGTALDKGQASADALYSKAYTPFSSLYDKFGKGMDAYADATGVNGADGISRAGSTFKALPGYSGGLTTGTDQLMRTAAARGDLSGGNTSGDIIKFASDYDAQKYKDYLAALSPNLSGASTAAAGGAGVLTGQAGADLGVAGTKASNEWNAATGSGQADANADLARYSASQNFWGALLGGANMALKASGVGGYATPSKAA